MRIDFKTKQIRKKGDLLNGNRIINLMNFITNLDAFLVCKEFAQERDLQIKLEDKRGVENFVVYVEAFLQLTPSDEQKMFREMYEDFKKQTYNRQKFSHKDWFCMSILEHINGLAYTIEFKCNSKTRQTPQQPSFYSSSSSANQTSF